MSWKFRDIFALVALIVGVISVLLLGGLPSNGDDLESLVVFFIIYTLGISIFTWGFGRFQKLQMISSTPTSKIRSMAKGNVEVKGASKALDETLTSPLSQEECLYYKYQVRERKRNSRGKKRWKTIDSGEEYAEFAVDDGTGVAVVDPDGADFDLPTDQQIRVRGGEEPPEKVKRFIEESRAVDKGRDGLLSFTNNTREYSEWYITPEEDLYIFGYSDNLDLDGENYHLIKDGESPLFYISDQSEEHIQDKWGTSYKLMIVGGIIATSIGYMAMASITGVI